MKNLECDQCERTVDVCLCQVHYDENLADEYERGVKDGKIAGHDETEEELKKEEEE